LRERSGLKIERDELKLERNGLQTGLHEVKSQLTGFKKEN